MAIDLSKSLAPLTIILASILIPITTILLLLRLYVRVFMQKKRLTVDDYVIIFSLASFVGLIVTTLLSTKYGGGRHLLDLLENNPEDLHKAVKCWWMGQHFYLLTICSVKLSVAIFFCSLNPPRHLRLAAIATTCVSLTIGFGTEMYYIFQCQPVAYFWTRFSPGSTGTCLDAYKAFVILQTTNSFDICTDLILAVLPAFMLYDLQIKARKKFTVGVLLGLGAIPTIAAITRACYFKPALLNPIDFTYLESPIGIASFVEPSVAICVVCIAQLRPLMITFFPGGWLTTTKSTHASKNPSVRPAATRHKTQELCDLNQGQRQESRGDQEMGTEKVPFSALDSQSLTAVHAESHHWED